MKVYVDIKITECKNSRELYDKVKFFGVNVTDMGEEVYVYSATKIERARAEKVVLYCLDYGVCEVKLG